MANTRSHGLIADPSDPRLKDVSLGDQGASATGQGRSDKRMGWVSLAVAIFSVFIAAASLLVSLEKDTSDQLRTATRDFQKGLVFSILLTVNTPMSIEQIQEKYKIEAQAAREKYHLHDQNFSREEIYSILLDLINNQSVKMRDVNLFSPKTDDDATQDRRIALEMLKFAQDHEFEYPYADFTSKFANWYSAAHKTSMSEDHALAVLAVALQSNIIGMGAKPGTVIKCLGEVPPLFIGSSFALRSHAPAILPALAPCPK